MPDTPLTDQQLADALVAAITEDGLKPRADRVGLVEAMLAVVRPELDRLTTAFEVAVSECAKAQEKRDKHKQRAEIANTELETLRGGLREIGGDPTQVQNLYAQLSLRGRQWQEAKAERDEARAEQAQRRDEVLAEAAELASSVIGPLWHLDTLHEIRSRILAARSTPDGR